MADAKKCDRCGAFYTENIIEVGDEFANICHPAKIKVIGDNGGLVRTLDLCDNCQIMLAEFLSAEGGR